MGIEFLTHIFSFKHLGLSRFLNVCTFLTLESHRDSGVHARWCIQSCVFTDISKYDATTLCQSVLPGYPSVNVVYIIKVPRLGWMR